VAEACSWSMEVLGEGNEQIIIYFNQIHVYSLNDIIHNEYHDYPLVATACRVFCMMYTLANSQVAHCAPINVARCAPCGQVENKCGSRKIYFRTCYYTS